MIKSPLVYIIILVYNGKKWIDNCLDSVLKTDYPNYKILIVDNASKDGSTEYIADKFPHVELIRNNKNYGFAEGNNIGMRYALNREADYVILLNQDTKVESGWIKGLVTVAEIDKKIGILSPMQYDYEGKDLDRNFRELLKNNFPDHEFIETDRVIGAAMLYRVLIAKEVGLFDPIYFCYHEESDLCRRVKYFGYKVGVVKAGRIYHWHSLIQKNGLSKKERDLFIKNELIYALKDPNKSLVVALIWYYGWKIKSIIKEYGILKGLQIFFVSVAKQTSVLFRFPRIISRKKQESKTPCLSVR